MTEVGSHKTEALTIDNDFLTAKNAKIYTKSAKKMEVGRQKSINKINDKLRSGEIIIEKQCTKPNKPRRG